MAKNYKEIVRDFDTIRTVQVIESSLPGIFVKVQGTKNGKPLTGNYQYKEMKVAKEVAKSVKYFIF
jgi:hypothetical protein